MERTIINNSFARFYVVAESVYTFARHKRRTLMIVCVDTYMDVFRFIIL